MSSSRPKTPAAFITSAVFSASEWPANHPLSISRHQNVMDVCRMLGWLHDDELAVCEPATEAVLTRLHEPGYVTALEVVSQIGKVTIAQREAFNFGTMENPVFTGLFDRAAATVSGSVLAAELSLEGRQVFHPAGGTHHGRPDRASGFCYFNDPAFAIQTLLDSGCAKVVYLDLDAHHGDGVESIFASNARVLCVSIHEEKRWPHTGQLADRAGGFARNLPVPKGFNDAELAFLMTEAVLPLIARFDPDAVVMTCGADALAGDPLSGMELGNEGLWSAIDSVREAVPVSVCLGGGGYNPWTVTRFWSGLWGRLAGYPPAPEQLPDDVQAYLSRLGCDLIDEDEVEPHWLNSFADPAQHGQAVRDAVRALVPAVLAG
ncbi:hypothetical protein V0U79_05130 [Hyphobacterium sp. HN65]|uniref:Histone deacetylase domain-containing protein n=1 Tax=Hyphobacterium lacteum TaxID=3116575 RepID=A0ABU7LP90_9PROT|nr:hypothetical protein [Hyphobacterium sp. HN65]MEE2525741.1 hypothetical protein [Hyphobacterium sp. HN65]